MDENLTQAIARLVDRGFDLDTLTPDGTAVVLRGAEQVELRVEDGRVMMRGDIPRDLVRSPISTPPPAGRLAPDPPLERADVAAPGMASASEGEQRSGRGGRRARRRRRWLMALLVLLLLVALATPLVLVMLDRSISDLWPVAANPVGSEASASASAVCADGARILDRARHAAQPRVTSTLVRWSGRAPFFAAREPLAA